MNSKKPTYKELEKKVFDLEAKLNERVKELSCISELSKLAESKENIDNILTKLPYILKKSWQFPDITEAKITANGAIYQTQNFKETSWVMHSVIFVQGKAEGEIHIAYHENKTNDTDPFLEEEYELLRLVSIGIGEIIERKKTLQTLQVSEAQKRVILNGISANITFVDLDLRIIWANEAAVESVNKKPEEVIGQHCYALWADPNKVCDECPANKAIKTKRKEQKIISTPDGRVWEESGEPVFDGDGKLIGIVEIAQDITDKVKIEQYLKTSEEKYRSVFDFGLSAILIADDNGNYTSVNHAAAALFGYTVDELMEMNVGDLVTTIEPGAEERYKLYLEKGEENGEFEFLTKNGEKKIAIYRAVRIKDNFNLSMLFDITERKKAELTIQESEAKFREIFNRVNDAIFIYNPENYEIVEANNATSQIYGYTEKELIGMSCLKFSTEVDSSKTASKKAEENGGELVHLRHHVKKDGSLITVEIFVSKIFSDNKTLMFAVSRDITELIEAIKVNESEARFKNMFLRHNATMLLIEPETGAIIDANNTATIFYGYSKSKLCSMKIDDLNALSPEQVSIERSNALKEKRNHFIFTHQLANREIRKVEVHSSPIQFQDKRILFSIIYDITERKKAEQALIESEKKLNIWINNSPVCTKIVDLDFNLQFMSETGIRELKIDDITKFYGKPYPFYFYPESFKVSMRNNLKKVKETGEKVVQEAYVLDVYGDELWYRSTLVPVFRNNGKLDYIMIVSLEITDRKLHERALKESEEKFRNIFNNSVVGKSITKMDGSISVNAAFSQLIGYSEDELNNIKWQEITHPDDIERSQSFIESIVAGKIKVARWEKRYINKKGRIVWVDVSTTLQRNLQGQPEHFITSVADITERKEAEQALKENETRLEKLNADKDKFISILAHDLKSPFNSMLGFSQLLNKNVRNYDIDKIENYVKVINTAGIKIYNLLEDILVWSRAQSGKIVSEPEQINFSEICQAIKEENNDRALSKDISLYCNMSANFNLFADINLLKTVMRNLISNAIKFTPQGGTITVNAKEERNKIIVSLTDTGVGIAKEMLPELFSIAKDNTTKGTNKEEGTGLGLQICKEFVEKMGGRIWVESEVGRGSVFYFTIPKQNSYHSDE